MPSYQNYTHINNTISKELLNKNRVLTMSNNRKCNYLIVDVGKDSTSMMAVNTQGNSKDILVIKTFVGKSISELVDEAYWLCNEFGIQIVLADNSGFGLGFMKEFDANINPNIVSIRALDGRKIYQNLDFNEIQKDLKYGNLRFLQTPELAKTSYIKPFLGLSNMMEFHTETNKLIDEISNIKVIVNIGKINFTRIDESIGRSRLNCLLAFYSYPMSGVVTEQISNEDSNRKYDITKRITRYEVIHGIFYKYIFKCIENKQIKVLFYHNGKHKIKQFQDIVEEEQFRSLFLKDIKSVRKSKDDFEIIFHNDSQIKFVYANDNARGYRCHYAVVDSEIEREVFDNVIRTKTILFDIGKSEGKIKDIYNIDFVEM